MQLQLRQFNGRSVDQIAQWVRDSVGVINQALKLLSFPGSLYVWNEGKITVPTSTTIAGAEVIIFESPVSGNGAIIVTGVGFEGGIHVAVNDVDLGALSDADTVSEIQYELQISNLVEGINAFKIWSTTADAGELRRLEVYRNFTSNYAP